MNGVHAVVIAMDDAGPFYVWSLEYSLELWGRPTVVAGEKANPLLL